MTSMKERWSNLDWSEKSVLIITSPISVPMAICAAIGMLIMYGIVVGVSFILGMEE